MTNEKHQLIFDRRTDDNPGEISGISANVVGTIRWQPAEVRNKTPLSVTSYKNRL